MAFDKNSTAAEVVAGHDLTGKEVIVTGGASGLGAETARVLALAGARVVVAGRDAGRGEAAVRRLREETGNRAVEFSELDLGSLASVRAFTERYAATGRSLHLLINNAGVMASPLTYTEDGFESQFGTNHLGHFALTAGLRPALAAAGGGARVVALSSRAHRRGDIDLDDPNYRHRPYDPWESYGQSKSANALFAVELTERWATDGITANALNPGAIMTDLQRHIATGELQDMGWADADGNRITPQGWKTVEQGAATTIWAAVAPELEGVGGHYLDDCAIATPWTADDQPPFGHYLARILDPERAERLWTLSEKLIG
ncbi:SDR family NAD(P)-dependent oxidoreductase [Actinomadura barringtoniae]|nr:SDR family NAD(P)-dependent oxidoreductase [Actinomadura barringtoniae]